MIQPVHAQFPTEQDVLELWNACSLPEYKRIHCRLVSVLALWMARTLMSREPSIRIDLTLLSASALLHDIDKAVPKQEGEHHPDAGVRILSESGFPLVADVVRTHPLHAILDQNIAPRTWEQKLLYLSDKMVKLSILTVDRRFQLWRDESLPEDAVTILDRSYPLVKALERDVFTLLEVDPRDAAALAMSSKTDTIRLRESGSVKEEQP